MRRPRGQWLTVAAWIAGLGLIALVIRLGGAGLQEAVASASWGYLIAGLLLATTLYPLASLRWSIVTNRLCARRVAPYVAFLQIRSLSAAGGFFAPRELVELGGRALWLTKVQGLSMSLAARSVLVDRFCDLLISASALCGALSLWILGLPVALSLMVAVGCIALAILVTPPVMRALAGLTRRLHAGASPSGTPARGVARPLAWLRELADIPTDIWRIALGLTLLKLTLLAVRLLLLAAAVDLSVEPLELVVSMPIGQIGYALGITPGALGIYEAGWFGLLHLLGAEPGPSAAFVVLLRLSLVTSVLFVLPFAFAWRGRLQRLQPGPGPAD